MGNYMDGEIREQLKMTAACRKEEGRGRHMETEQRTVNDLTEQIIGCVYTVGNTLGAGFLRDVYENALVHEMQNRGLRVSRQHAIQVHYDHAVVGEYVADIVVEGCVLVELRAVRALEEADLARCLHYLKATGMHLCLLINFGNPRVTVKRIVHALSIDDEQL
jgi:GxxExxY protein